MLANEEQLRHINAYMEVYHERDKQLEKAFNHVHAFQILEEALPFEMDDVEDEVPSIFIEMNEQIEMNENEFQMNQQDRER